MTRSIGSCARRPLPKAHYKIRSIIVAASLSACMPTGFAASFMTLGPYDCGQWFANSKPKREVAKTWLMGFLSGMNAMVALSASGEIS